jgi:hypothetical protein
MAEARANARSRRITKKKKRRRRKSMHPSLESPHRFALPRFFFFLNLSSSIAHLYQPPITHSLTKNRHERREKIVASEKKNQGDSPARKKSVEKGDLISRRLLLSFFVG